MSETEELKNRPRYLEYKKPRGRGRQYCCYKDDPCEIHARVLCQLLDMVLGKIDVDPISALGKENGRVRRGGDERTE